MAFTDFYRQQRWISLRLQLWSERETEEGVICWHCHKVIPKGRDARLHHKKELTPQNINDENIAYNPDNLEFVHHKCHDEIHNRFGGQLQGNERRVYIVYGSPCSGKTTFVKENKSRDDLVVDIDNIWESITCERYNKPNSLFSHYVMPVWELLLGKIKMRAGSWRTAWVITGGACKADREGLAASLGAELIFIDTDKITCLERLSNDENRRFVQQEWQGYINNWFEEYQAE